MAPLGMRILKALVFFSSLFLLTSCDSRSGSEGTNDSAINSQPAVTPEIQSHKESSNKIQTYTVGGTVISILPNQKHIIIDHDEIPGFMNAMTMPFNVADPKLIENIARQDNVTFTFEVIDGALILTEIRRTPQDQERSF